MGIINWSALMGKFGYEKAASAPVPIQSEERKFDVRDWNSFTPIQQDILADQALSSTSAYAHVWVYNYCVRKISQTAASIYNYAYLENERTGERVEGNEIFNTLTNRCNSIYDGQEQIETLISFYIMKGACYERVIGTPKMLIEIWPLLANNVTAEPGDKAKGEPIIKWFKEQTTGRPIFHKPEEVIYSRTFNPDSHIEGVPWLIAASKKIETLSDAESFNASVLKNGVFPSINYHTDKDMTDTQISDVKRQLKAQGGPDGAAKVMLTHSGFKASAMAFSPEEMQILENERYIASVIATSMGVPPEILGTITDKKTYLNAKEAYADFINSTVLPTLEKINKKRNFYFWPNGENKIKLNKKMIDAFKRDATDLATSYWITPDQKLEEQGKAATGLDYMQKHYIPSSYVLMEDLMEKEDEENL